ncbi:MAG TPA: hypothetical protein VGB17_14230 [Pyrinomonadaceae bacterium]|jgi:hypothetical protein
MATAKLDPEAQRAQRVEDIKALCRALNEAGAVPHWSPGHLHGYINAKFDVLYGLDSMAFASFDELERDLASRLEALTGKPAGRTCSHIRRT